jgi:hypothetical protein
MSVGPIVRKLARAKRMDRGLAACLFLSGAINYLARNYWGGEGWRSEGDRIAYLVLMRAILHLLAESMMPRARREPKP